MIHSLVDNVHVLIRHLVPLVMWNHIFKAESICGAFGPRRDDVPRTATPRQMVQRRELPSQDVRIRVARAHGDS